MHPPAPTASPGPPLTVPDLSRWLQALPLSERAERIERGSDSDFDPDRAAQRLARWRDELGPAADDLPERLREVGLDEPSFRRLLGESPEALAQRVGVAPPWLADLLAAYEEAGREPPGVPDSWRTGDPRYALLTPILPLVAQAGRRLRDGLADLVREHPAAPFVPEAVAEVLLAALPEQLLPLLSRTVTLELHAARLAGRLTGATPEERFASFVAALAEPARALELLAGYPVLARQLALHLEQWAAGALELCERLAGDADLLSQIFFGGRKLHLRALSGGAGDRHGGGRTVAVLVFADGDIPEAPEAAEVRLVYKPRSLAIEARFQELLAHLNGWLAERGAGQPLFPLLKVLDRGAYGWVEWVAARPCGDPAEVERFYRRQGGTLALLHALAATDFHQENLIARGEEPVPVDLESLFHPDTAGPAAWGGAGDPASDFLTRSVARAGLLPQRIRMREGLDGVDISGLGSLAGQRAPTLLAHLAAVGTDAMRLVRDRPELADTGSHRPQLAGEKPDPRHFRAPLLAGFTAVYRTLAAHRDELLAEDGPLAPFRAVPARAILRPTFAYGRLLQESFHPTLLRNALDRDRFFDRLRQRLAERPALAPAVAAEQADLWRGDIPAFTVRPGSRDLWTAAGGRIHEVFAASGLDEARRRIAALGEDDLALQMRVIEMSLASLAASLHGLPRVSYAERPPSAPVTRERLLAAAERAAERLAVTALHGPAGEVSWLGLELRGERDWEVAPVGPDLYGGLPGIALFLATLGDVTGEPRWTRLARQALAPLLRWLAEGRLLYPSAGGFGGWGGFFWALAHLGVLWRDRDLHSLAASLLGTVAAALEGETEADLIGGLAGGAVSLLVFHQATGEPAALAAAVRAAERLLATGWPPSDGRTPPLAGFSHGAAGIAWALLRLAGATGRGDFRDAALRALAYERTLFSPRWGNWTDLRDFGDFGGESPAVQDELRHSTLAWCHGAVGIGLARLGGLPWLDDDAVRAEIAAALALTRERGFGRSHCLCHGDLGSLELLAEAHRRLGDEQAGRELADRTAVLLESIEHDGFLCGVPTGCETPGLMAGLSGIGHGLLRLAVGDRVPSVLLLASPADFR